MFATRRFHSVSVVGWGFDRRDRRFDCCDIFDRRNGDLDVFDLGRFFHAWYVCVVVDGRDNIGAAAAERFALFQRALNGASGQRVGAWTLSYFGNRPGVQVPEMDSGLGGPLVFYGLDVDQWVTNDPPPQNGGLKLVGSLHPFDGRD